MTNEDKSVLHKFVQEYLIPTDFVVVKRIDGVRFIIHTKEQGHNIAHVHVEDNSCSFSISLEDFKVLNCTGNPTLKKIKMAQEFIMNNKELFIRNWNDFSNGIKVDLEKGVC